jgi:hypothetical protein
MKFISYAILSGLLAATACSHMKKDCCANKESCSKEKKECCDKKTAKCEDGSCDKKKVN